jgi:hypothetical protein
LAALLASTPNALSASICDPDDTAVVQSLGDALNARMRAGCLPGAVLDLAEPGCSVDLDGAAVPRCSAGGRLPCWDLAADSGCPARPTSAGALQRLRLVVEGAPTGAAPVASCPLYEPAP